MALGHHPQQLHRNTLPLHPPPLPAGELSTLGNRWADVAYSCMPYHLPAMPGLARLHLPLAPGIPTEQVGECDGKKEKKREDYAGSERTYREGDKRSV